MVELSCPSPGIGTRHDCLLLSAGARSRRSKSANALLSRIGALDAEVNAFCLIDEPHDFGAGPASEERWVRGAPLSPLDGVPVAVKDTLAYPRLADLARLAHHRSQSGLGSRCARSVARLREAGAVLLGKVTTPDHGWKGVTDSPLTGITRNPWNLDKTPGGSSGGSSAALAARLAPLALGTDGGGSIRIPAGLQPASSASSPISAACRPGRSRRSAPCRIWVR